MKYMIGFLCSFLLLAFAWVTHAQITWEAWPGEAASIKNADATKGTYDLSTIENSETKRNSWKDSQQNTSPTNTNETTLTQSPTGPIDRSLYNQFDKPELTTDISDEELVRWMYSQGMTKFYDIEEFGFDRSITRGEIVKFFTQYALSLGKKVDTSLACWFTDIDTYDSSLVWFIKQSCQLELVKGFEGQYMPNKTLSRAEGITVVIRALDGFLDETGSDRWSQYQTSAVQKNIVDASVIDFTQPVARGVVGRWIYNAMVYDQSL